MRGAGIYRVQRFNCRSDQELTIRAKKIWSTASATRRGSREPIRPASSATMRRSKNAAPGWRTPRAGARYGPRAISLVRLAAPLLRSFGSTSRTKDALTPGVNAGARRAIRSTPTRPFRLRQIHPASGDREPECNPRCVLSGRPDFSGVGTRPIGRRAPGRGAGLAIAALLGFGYKGLNRQHVGAGPRGGLFRSSAVNARGATKP